LPAQKGGIGTAGGGAYESKKKEERKRGDQGWRTAGKFDRGGDVGEKGGKKIRSFLWNGERGHKYARDRRATCREKTRR